VGDAAAADRREPQARLGHHLLGSGQDLAGEIYVLTTDQRARPETTERVYRLVRASG
jgi:prephenate dehydrogenase